MHAACSTTCLQSLFAGALLCGTRRCSSLTLAKHPPLALQPIGTGVKGLHVAGWQMRTVEHKLVMGRVMECLWGCMGGGQLACNVQHRICV